jgi:hypothetical protein
MMWLNDSIHTYKIKGDRKAGLLPKAWTGTVGIYCNSSQRVNLLLDKVLPSSILRKGDAGYVLYSYN